jgi:3-oxoacyl-ACP reductase-like protein
MTDSDSTDRLLLPKPHEMPQGREITNATERSNCGEFTNQPTPAFRRPKAPARTDEEWNASRENIQKLYLVDDFTLGMVINIMEAEHEFRAS